MSLEGTGSGWLKELNKQDKKAIGGFIKTVQYGWPLGMPVVRKMESGLWEIRPDNPSVTLLTLERAAKALGKNIRIELAA